MMYNVLEIVYCTQVLNVANIGKTKLRSQDQPILLCVRVPAWFWVCCHLQYIGKSLSMGMGAHNKLPFFKNEMLNQQEFRVHTGHVVY